MIVTELKQWSKVTLLVSSKALSSNHSYMWCETMAPFINSGSFRRDWHCVTRVQLLMHTCARRRAQRVRIEGSFWPPYLATLLFETIRQLSSCTSHRKQQRAACLSSPDVAFIFTSDCPTHTPIIHIRSERRLLAPTRHSAIPSQLCETAVK